MRIALCQIPTVTGGVKDNMESILGCIDGSADMYVFPELYLSGYMCQTPDMVAVDAALGELRDIASEEGICIIVGAPEYDGGNVYNCAYVITDTVERYRKIHLPDFGVFSERSRFVPGSEPFVFDFMGKRFGLCICYDIFFPELMKTYALDGADVNICISASPVTSRTAFERTVPARAVEDTTYVVFVNNIGMYDGMEFFGGSRILDPTGELLFISEAPGVFTFEPDDDVLAKARLGRPTLKDTAAEIRWPQR